MIAIISLLIFAAAFLFAMLGQGGGLVYVPVLKWFGYSVKEVAIPLGLLLNGLNTSLALIPYAKKGLVDWKGGAFLSVFAFVFAPLGAWSAQFLDTKLLIIGFSSLVLLAAIKMIFASGKKEPSQKASPKKRTIAGIVVGSFVGFIAGLLGIGGGFIIAPVLMSLGYKVREAAATTALVVTVSSFSGYAGHALHHLPDWKLLLGTMLAVLLGSQLGVRFSTTTAKPVVIKRIYAIVLLAISVKLFWGVFA